MSIYGELYPMPVHKTQFTFNGKRQHIPKETHPYMAYPNQHIDNKLPHSSRDHVTVQDTQKITFNLDMESTEKTRSIVYNVGRALAKKKVLMLGLKKIDTINNSDISSIHKGLYLKEKRLKDKLLEPFLCQIY